jgi:cell wall-associated NlpC family hydrolase
MSVADVQLRIDQLQARFQGVTPKASAGAAPAATGRRFAATLERALGAAGGLGAARGVAPFGGNGAAVSGDAVVKAAMVFEGVPYRWGGESPDGFDCSGLVQYVFGRHGVDLPRVAKDQARAGVPVAVADLRPGDLVFFGSPVDHVGISAGGDKMVVAPKTGDVVKVQTFDPDTVTAARRVLPAGADTSWADRLPAAGKRFAGAIDQAAQAAGVDPKLLAALTWTESGFNPGAQSSAGALGLTQLMPATASGLGVDPADPAQNLLGGARYLASQLQRFGRLDHALAAYNAGPSAVARAGGVPSYPETQAYVARVLDRLRSL